MAVLLKLWTVCCIHVQHMCLCFERMQDMGNKVTELMSDMQAGYQRCLQSLSILIPLFLMSLPRPCIVLCTNFLSSFHVNVQCMIQRKCFLSHNKPLAFTSAFVQTSAIFTIIYIYISIECDNGQENLLTVWKPYQGNFQALKF